MTAAAAAAAAANVFKYGTARRLIAVTSCKGGVGFVKLKIIFVPVLLTY